MTETKLITNFLGLTLHLISKKFDFFHFAGSKIKGFTKEAYIIHPAGNKTNQ